MAMPDITRVMATCKPQCEGSILKSDSIPEAPLIEETKFSVEGYRTFVRGPDPEFDFLRSGISLCPNEQVLEQGGPDTATEVPRMDDDCELEDVRDGGKIAERLEECVPNSRAIKLGNHAATATGELLELRFESINRNLHSWWWGAIFENGGGGVWDSRVCGFGSCLVP
jgi:hypothetical protein